MGNAEAYIMRTDAIEGRVFYDNLLNSPSHLKKYFPPGYSEKSLEYNQRPKVSVPIASQVIDRITNILVRNIEVVSDAPHTIELIDLVESEMNLKEEIRNVIVNTLVGGNNLLVFRAGIEKFIIEHWKAPYIIICAAKSGYQYRLTKDLQMLPVLNEKEEEKSVTVWIDDVYFGDDFEHGFDFTPSVLTRSVDRYENMIYGKSFVERLNNMIIEYNQIFSQAMYSIKVLQNVWATNRNQDNPNKPIRLSPGVINHMGMDGKLEQVVRQLNLTEEWTMLKKLEEIISRSSQVPSELWAQLAGKLPSGIALEILLEPLQELIDRSANIFMPAIKEIYEKSIKLTLFSKGFKPDNDIDLTVISNNKIIPETEALLFDKIERAQRNNWISDEEAKQLTRHSFELK